MKPEDFKKIRKDKKLTQSDLGALLGVGIRTIQKYESGINKIPLSIVKTLEYEFDSQKKSYAKDTHVVTIANKQQVHSGQKCPICQKNEEINQLLRDKIAYLEEKLELYQGTDAVKSSSLTTKTPIST